MTLENFSGQYFIFFIIILFFSLATLILVRKLLKISFPYFFIGLMGLIIGAIIGSMVTAPLGQLPGEYGRWLPLIANVFITVSIIDLFIAQARPVSNFFSRLSNKLNDGNLNAEKILIDTSVLIDGRIENILKTGFLMGEIVIPQSVLNELQMIADSTDSLKRAKGRKGMDVLTNLQHNGRINVSIFEDNRIGREPVDNRLVKLAKSHNAKILTMDYNLNKIAKIQKITVLNINELAESIKPILIPGEDIQVKIIQEGKEPNQGVGYLPDGTMIVVEGGESLIGKEIMCEVIRIFQTVAGKMIFVVPKKSRTRKMN